MENDKPTTGIGLTFSVGDTALPPAKAFCIAVLARLNSAAAATATLTANDDINVVLRTIAPAVSMYFDPSPIDSGNPLTVDLRITSTADLSPAGVIAQVPALTALILFRQRLEMFRTGELTEDEFSADLDAYRAFPELHGPLDLWDNSVSAPSTPENRLRTTGSPSPDKSGDKGKDAALDRIFDLLGAEDAEAPPSSSATSTVVGQALSGIVKGRKPPRVDLEPIRTATTRTINAILDAILHHPDFQRLETTVRGLRFLRSRVREGFKIFVVDTGDLDAPKAFRRLGSADLGSGATVRDIDLVLLEQPIRRTSAALAGLEELGELAEQAQIPTIIGLASDFLEIEGVMPSSVRVLHDHPAFLSWKSLRGKDCARWIVATFNPLLLRSPYTSESTRELDYRESVAASSDLLWGQAGWLIVERLLAAISTHGWPIQIDGSAAGCVDSLELYDRSADAQIPLRLPVSPEEALDLAELGITAPACEPNRDRAYILRIPMLLELPRLANPEQDRQVRRMARLDFQLVAVRLARLIEELRPRLDAASTPAGRSALLQKLLQAKIAETGKDAAVTVTLSPADDERAEVVVQLGGNGLDRIPVVLQAPL